MRAMRLRPPRHARPLPRMRCGAGECGRVSVYNAGVRRLARYVLTVLSLALCFATVVGWAHGRYRSDAVLYELYRVDGVTHNMLRRWVILRSSAGRAVVF